jgi:hypothetical protein
MVMRAIPGWTVVVLLAAGTAMAAEERAINLDAYQSALLQASGHPNELNRWHGIWNYDNGRQDEALKYFLRAAAYGDKLSQHFLALMYWNGDGVDRDPVQAYVWADLAAERGNSPDLIRVREHIWHELTPTQQAQSVEMGQGYYERYGDQVAQRRTNTEIRRFARTQTGSRVGLLTSRLEVNAGRPDLWAGGGRSSYGPLQATGTEFYADSRTRPTEYWQAEDLSLGALMKRIGAGEVKVGDVDVVKDGGK